MNMISLFAIIIAFITGFCFGTHFGAFSKKLTEEAERDALFLIKSRQGEITPLELASETKLTISESEKFLEKLITSGQVSKTILKNGQVGYLFSEFKRTR